MKTPGFVRGVIVALILSLFVTVTFSALTPVFSGGEVLRILISTATFAYIIYLLCAAEIRFGRITTAAMSIVAAGILLYWSPPLAAFISIHIGLIWLTRCFYYHNSVLIALCDLGLSALGFAAAIWAIEQSHSLFMAFWCFFLIQAGILPVLNVLPERFSSASNTGSGGTPSDGEAFQRAYRTAETALRKLSSLH